MTSHIETIVLSDEMIKTLCDGEIDQVYLDKVEQLHKILVNSRNSDFSESRSMQEIKPELDKLKLKVCARARSFLIVKMNNLRKPKTNF
jgi:vacuolar protein sorting-associated protein 52